MDPWTPPPSSRAPGTPDGDLSTPRLQVDAAPPGFENSFLSDDCHDSRLPVNTNIQFEKLPDSAEYLARLEGKLRKVRGGGGARPGARQEAGLVAEVRGGREAAIHQLLAGEGGLVRSQEEVAEEQEVRSNYLTRRILPQQPITRGEQVELTRADALEQTNLQEQEQDNLQGQDLQEQKEHENSPEDSRA